MGGGRRGRTAEPEPISDFGMWILAAFGGYVGIAKIFPEMIDSRCLQCSAAEPQPKGRQGLKGRKGLMGGKAASFREKVIANESQLQFDGPMLSKNTLL